MNISLAPSSPLVSFLVDKDSHRPWYTQSWVEQPARSQRSADHHQNAPGVVENSRRTRLLNLHEVKMEEASTPKELRVWQPKKVRNGV